MHSRTYTIFFKYTCRRAQTRIRTQVLEEGEVVIIDTQVANVLLMCC
jgi:hypothetical protein